MTQWKCFAQTHFLFVAIYGLVWSSSVTFKHKMCHWLRDITLSSNSTKFFVLVKFRTTPIDSCCFVRGICGVQQVDQQGHESALPRGRKQRSSNIIIPLRIQLISNSQFHVHCACSCTCAFIVHMRRTHFLFPTSGCRVLLDI